MAGSPESKAALHWWPQVFLRAHGAVMCSGRAASSETCDGKVGARLQGGRAGCWRPALSRPVSTHSGAWWRRPGPPTLERAQGSPSDVEGRAGPRSQAELMLLV